MPVRAVFLDIGETLISEARLWDLWARWLGVSPLTFFAALGAVIERRQDHRLVFELFRQGFDLAAARRERSEAGWPDDSFAPEDMYPDALPCLTELRSRGYVVGIAGNQPRNALERLAPLLETASIIASSEAWGVAKPARAFFERLVRESGHISSEVAYVGDRIDNDVHAAQAAGLVAIHIKRGPWALIQSRAADAALPYPAIDGLEELPDLLGTL